MTTLEFSNNFDTLVNSYNIDATPSIEFNEYEKSFFLTQAENLLVQAAYDDGVNNSFEISEEARRQLDSIVKTAESPEQLEVIENSPILGGVYKHTVYKLPEDCWYIVYEEFTWGDCMTCAETKTADVLPVTHDDYNRIVRNPFRGPASNRVLRLDKGDTSREVELVYPSKMNNVETSGEYKIRYVKKPKPIILINLPEESSIDGSTEKQECELPTVLHWAILQGAVQLALTTKKLYTTSNNN